MIPSLPLISVCNEDTFATRLSSSLNFPFNASSIETTRLRNKNHTKDQHESRTRSPQDNEALFFLQQFSLHFTQLKKKTEMNLKTNNRILPRLPNLFCGSLCCCMRSLCSLTQFLNLAIELLHLCLQEAIRHQRLISLVP